MANPLIKVETIQVAPPDRDRSNNGGPPVVPVEPLCPPQSSVDAALTKARALLAREAMRSPTLPDLADYGLTTAISNSGNSEQK